MKTNCPILKFEINEFYCCSLLLVKELRNVAPKYNFLSTTVCENMLIFFMEMKKLLVKTQTKKGRIKNSML